MEVATQGAKKFRNVNLPLSEESRRALRTGRTESLTAIVEEIVREQLKGEDLVVRRPPRNTPRVCLSMDPLIAERLHRLSDLLDAPVSDVVYSIIKPAIPRIPSAAAPSPYRGELTAQLAL